MRNDNTSNEAVIEDEENELYCELPPGVVFPELDATHKSRESSASSSPPDQRLFMKLYSFSYISTLHVLLVCNGT